MEKKGERDSVLEGYRKIAFGSVCDPVRLLFEEEVSRRTLKGMDLFNVASIRKIKGGGMEIKFFDRLKALQGMREMNDAAPGGSELYTILEKSAGELRGDNA